jgi:hypothetical protein
MKDRSSPPTERLERGALGGVLLQPEEVVDVGGDDVGVGCCEVGVEGGCDGSGEVTLGAQAERESSARNKHKNSLFIRR